MTSRRPAWVPAVLTRGDGGRRRRSGEARGGSPPEPGDQGARRPPRLPAVWAAAPVGTAAPRRASGPAAPGWPGRRCPPANLGEVHESFLDAWAVAGPDRADPVRRPGRHTRSRRSAPPPSSRAMGAGPSWHAAKPALTGPGRAPRGMKSRLPGSSVAAGRPASP